MICTSLPNARENIQVIFFFLSFFFFPCLDQCCLKTKTDLMEERDYCSLTSAMCFSPSPVKFSTMNKQSAMSWNTRIQRADSNEITLKWGWIKSEKTQVFCDGPREDRLRAWGLKGMHKDLGIRPRVLVCGLWDPGWLPTLYEPVLTFMGMATAFW